MTGTSAVESRKLYEVMDHMTLSYDSAIEFVAVINNDFFESLSAEHQKIILDAAAVVEQQLRDQVYSSEDSIVGELRSKMTVIDLTDAERAQWREATKGVIDQFIAAHNENAAPFEWRKKKCIRSRSSNATLI